MNGGTKISGVRMETSELPVLSGRKAALPVNEKAKKINVKNGGQSSAKESGGKVPAESAVSAKSGAPEKGNVPEQGRAAAFSSKATKLPLQKNSSAAPHSSLSNLPPQNPGQSAGVQISPNPSGAPGENMTAARELFRQAAASFGFPPDLLSVTLLAFSRFFSISPGKEFLGKLRRELLSLKASSPGNSKEETALEAEALAAAAAFDKGVTLSGPALEHYARFFMPPAPSGEKQGGEGSACGTHAGQAAAGTEPKERRSPGKVPAAEEIRAIAEEGASKDSLLDFLNRLPGKNGHYWFVFPFKITVKGIELSVFIRTLKGESLFSREDGYVIVDIESPEKQWRCFLGKKSGKFRADIRVSPELSAKALAVLKKDAGRFFGKDFGEILVRSGEEFPSWAEDLCDLYLPSINEEV